MKMNKRIPQKISFVIFFGLLIIMPIITFCLPKDDFSDVENRVLASFPKISYKNIFNRKFMSGFESYFADHFAGRNEWISVNTDMELIAGKREINNVYILDDMLVEKISSPDEIGVTKNINAINNFPVNSGIQTYVMIVPTSAGIYPEKLPNNAPNIDQKSSIDAIYGQFSDDIITLNAYSALYAEKDEYIYYRNDHHWTTLGAYYTYAATGKKMGFTPAAIDDFNIEHASNEFLGTLYSKAIYDKIPADTLDIYYPTGDVAITSVEIQEKKLETYDDYYFRDYLGKKDKYAVFGGQNQPFVRIKTSSPREQKLLVIKDSYANCYIPFLTQHYSEIVILDMRYIDTAYKNIIDVEEFDQALILYNYSSFTQDDNLKKLDF